MTLTASLDRLKPVFFLLSALGVYHTWGRMILDGSLSLLLTALHGSKTYVLPGTDSPLRTRITGIYWPIDYLLNILIVFFWEAVDGSHPATSAMGIYFLAQFLCMLAGIYVDSLRQGQSGRITLTRTMLWLLLFQMSAVACTGPLWALWYLASSPLAAENLTFKELCQRSRVPARPIVYLVPSLILGYLFSAVVMALPSPAFMSNDSQQLALVTWNIFPVLVHILMQVLPALIPAGKDRKANEEYATRTTIRVVNATFLWISFIVHAGLVSLSITTILFPTMWAPEMVQQFHPASLLLPPIGVTPAQTVGDGVRSFFLWDQLFGYIVGILVAWLELRTVLMARDEHQRWTWPKLIAGIVGGSLIAGPGSVCLALHWLRDELLLSPSTRVNRKQA